VLKGLFKCYKVLERQDILESVKLGYKYYREKLINKDNMPIHFAIKKHNKLRKYEMYDFAEGIKIGCLLDEDIEGSLDLAKDLAKTMTKRFQLKDGHFITRITSFGVKHKVPYHRWPQSQLFFALTDLLFKY
jgi:hypothetical protein